MPSDNSDVENAKVLKNMSKGRYIVRQLKAHAPFTAGGAVLGIIFMLIFKRYFGNSASLKLFYVFHPSHVFLSAMTTAAMYKLHKRNAGLVMLIVIGWVGSIGIATLSDSVIPYLGESMLGLHISVHHHGGDGNGDHNEPATTSTDIQKAGGNGQAVNVEHAANGNYITNGNHIANSEHTHEHKMHIGFIEKWKVVNPAAFLGILVAFFWSHTKFSHLGHVLLSIWASLFHILANMGGTVSTGQWAGVFIFLFLAVWLPCCISDIVFPLLLVKKPGQMMPVHKH